MRGDDEVIDEQFTEKQQDGVLESRKSRRADGCDNVLFHNAEHGAAPSYVMLHMHVPASFVEKFREMGNDTLLTIEP